MTDMVARPISLKTMVTDRLANTNYLCSQEISSLNSMSEEVEVHAGMAEAAIYIYQQVGNTGINVHVHCPLYKNNSPLIICI